MLLGFILERPPVENVRLSCETVSVVGYLEILLTLQNYKNYK